MEDFFLKKIKEKLEKERVVIEKELQNFAKKDEKSKGDWNTRFPKFNGSSGSGLLEEAAEEVEEYITKLPIEHSLEIRLRDIDLALGKLEKGQYGKCEKCGQDILKERLEIYPDARHCLKRRL